MSARLKSVFRSVRSSCNWLLQRRLYLAMLDLHRFDSINFGRALTVTSASGKISISGSAASSSIRPTSRSISISISAAIVRQWYPGYGAVPRVENRDTPIRCTSMRNRYVNTSYKFRDKVMWRGQRGYVVALKIRPREL